MGQPAYRQEEITDIVRDIDSNAHLGKVKAVAQPDESKRDNVMEDQLLEILSRLFQLQHEDKGLLRPVGRLQQIICLKHTFMLPVRESFEHGCGVEVPQRTLGA